MPEKVMIDARERMQTTKENMNRPLHEYISPDIYDKYCYDAYNEGFDGTNTESRGLLD